MKPWHEQDAFWEDLEGHLFSPARLEQTAGEVDQVLALAGVKPGATVLDLCCGPGRHSMELAHRGFAVMGVDRTRRYVEEARRNARARGLSSAQFSVADMRSFRQPDAFDLVINLFTSFGYFEDPADDRRVMDNVYASLRRGGRFLIDTHGKESLAARFRPRDWYEEDGAIFLEERVVSQDWGWIDSRWNRLQADRRSEFRVSHRLYSAVELKRLARDAGFSEAVVFGALDGTPYDHRATRLVLLAAKGSA